MTLEDEYERQNAFYSHLIQKVRYKDNFRMWVPISRSRPTLSVTMYVMESRRRTGKITISKDVNIPSNLDREDFLEWVRVQLQEMELHEVDEWFSFDNALFKDPHDPANYELADREIRA